jgi:enamine deaminase RidA (YjgF/YER057c/UK114 family)
MPATSAVLERLKQAGIELPEPRAPVANYVPFVITGNLLFISGQVSSGPKGLVAGRIGRTMTMEEGYEAAKLCGINLIAQAQAALGDLDRVSRVVKVGGFVHCTKDFTEIPKVINGCSDLFVTAFGDKGKHARFAVAAPVLPMGAAVEVDAVIEFS